MVRSGLRLSAFGGWCTTSARDLGKNVELTIEGAETELDKTSSISWAIR